MAGSLIGVALTGLNAARVGLDTTGHNIANVNTPGYSRQSSEQRTNFAQLTGAGFIGRGVNVETVRRAYDEFAAAQSWEAASQAAQWQAFEAEVNALSAALADPGTSPAAATASFFAAVNDLAAFPSDPAARQAMLSAAQTMASRFGAMQERIDQVRFAIDSEVRSAVDVANQLAARIADLNSRISIGQATGHEPNDLLDQRDALVTDLAQIARVQTVRQSDGALNVFLGNGQPLVVGAQATTLAAAPDLNDAEHAVVGLNTGAGFVRFRAEDLGGQLGGLLTFRDQALDPASNEIGRIAITLAAEVNAQQRLGLDRNGTFGTDLFAAGAPRSLSAASNTGTAQLGVSITNYQALTTSDYRVDWDGTNWTVTRLSDSNVQTFTTLPQTIDGVAISVASGTANAGDSFLVQPTREGAASFQVLINNPALIAAAAPI